jgi:alpha-tubulin suppressor-like RCC1 family protein
MIHKFKLTSISNVSSGKSHVGFITKKGELFMMGNND